MRKIALLLVFFAAISSCKKKDDVATPPPPPHDSLYNYYTNTITGKFSTTFTCDGNVIMLASPFRLRAQPRDIMLYKLSQMGAMLWSKTIVLPDTAFYGPPAFNSIAATADGGYLLCGDAFKKEPYAGSFIFSTDVALLKLSATGNVEWLKTFGGGNEDYGNAIIKLKDGNYLLAGQSVSFNANLYSDIYLVKVDEKGNEIWSRDYDIYEQQHLDDIFETTSGNIMVYATDQYGTGHSTAMLLAADASGNELWHKTLATGNIGASCAVETAGGFMAGYNANGDPHIVQVSATGDVLWNKGGYLPTSGFQYSLGLMSMKKNSDNTFTLTGNLYHVGDSFKTVVLKIDANGNTLFNRTLPVYYNNTGLNILTADNGNNIITGQITRDSTVSDIFFSKTNNY